MASPTPLKGTDLVDCAKANAKQGTGTAAQLCGYGEDVNTFTRELKQACQRMGIEVNDISDLITEQDVLIQKNSDVIAPDTPSSL
ncbi:MULTISPECIES: hypothetical protein [unclassified Coleofasciculus]|uniref:hypothetical protein n=1 Tax=unclassified Coleofasciculus TaxID=2692782 RepID=UPI00187E6DE9|nr:MULTISPECIES: hypothetical protein [unclassified Coleofasciculus]MBE9129860.1 hypothetical protein [Coleofasciculus sp. LEGE 07081]MBE9152312.1 hypothetical protein [Coleofasciculus sp. LEGE 07092]